METNTSASIPGFQYFMLPFLKVISDGKTRHMKEIYQLVISETGMTKEQCSIMLPSKAAKVVINRISWVRTYLYKAGLIKQVSRAYYHITPEGLKAIEDNPNGMKIAYLRTLPAFQSWGASSSKDDEDLEITEGSSDSVKTPREVLEQSYEDIMETVADDLLDRIKKINPAAFETLVVDVLLAMGYGGFAENRGEVTPYVGDGGIDGIIKEDKLGLDKIYVQAKRWENSVPVSAVRDFAGSLLSKKARKGVFITTSYFPQSAYDFVRSIDPTIVLIDGTMLAKLMLEHNVGVARDRVYEIKKIDSDYFDE